jgi:nucleotidyltransferase/DNA polymerase involved in DNA repair
MDAFYASIEQRDRPKFKGKPVVVGADPKNGHGRGVVSAASYEARKYGIHSAQPISQAYRSCPNAIFLPVRGRHYSKVSKRIISIFREYTPLVEPISLDEAFLDMTGTERLKGSVTEVAHIIKKRIKKEEQLTASVGIGPNKLIAKIASDYQKPDGFVQVKPENIQTFLDPLDVNKLWGIGRQMQNRLRDMGIRTIKDLRSLSESTLKDHFGKMGIQLSKRAHGIDNSRVISIRDVKSISNEMTFAQDSEDSTEHLNVLLHLSEKVGHRLRKKGLEGRTVILKVRLADFTTAIRHMTLSRSTALSETIYRTTVNLFQSGDYSLQPIRLLGVGVTQLSNTEGKQISLFDDENQKRQRVAQAMDILKEKYGHKIIGRGLRIKR